MPTLYSVIERIYTEINGKIQTDSPNWSEHLSDGYRERVSREHTLKWSIAIVCYVLLCFVLNENRLTMEWYMFGVLYTSNSNSNLYKIVQSHNRTEQLANIWKTISSTDIAHLAFLYFRTLGVMYHTRDKTQHHRKNEWRKKCGKAAAAMAGISGKKSLFSRTRFIVVHNIQFRGIDGLVSPECGVWVLIGFTKRWMLLLVSVLRIEQMLKIDPYAVNDFASKKQKHIQPKCYATNAPISRFLYVHPMWMNKKKSLLWTCCFDFVCFFLFLFLLFFILFLFAFIRICHLFNAFPFMFGFLNALYVLNMNRARVGPFYSAVEILLLWMTVFFCCCCCRAQFSSICIFAWKFGKIEWFIWIELIYIT